MPQETRSEQWKAQLDACRTRRDKLVKGPWQTNVSFRVQRPFSQTADEDADTSGSDQIAVPADWSRTRSKGASLFSLLPRIDLQPAHPRYAHAVPTFEKIVNHYTPLSGLMGVMEECCADVVNAAGMCAAIMKYEATFEEVLVPETQPPAFAGAPPQMGMQPNVALPPQPAPLPLPGGTAALPQGQMLLEGPSAPPMVPPGAPAPAPPMPPGAPPMDPLAGLLPPKMVPVTRTVSERWIAYRISPAQLLWPTEFKGSDWQRARWLGYDGTMPWARAKDAFNLSDEDKKDVCNEPGSTTKSFTLAGDQNTDVEKGGEQVLFSECFYWACLYDEKEKRFDAIRRIVFVKGKDEPVIDEPYAGQTWNPQTGQFAGCTRLPIEVATLTYISDKAVPPSDSEIGRPMVLEQIRSRSQMIMQRTRNLPIRTYDVNRIDPMIGDLLMRGVWQGMIPTNGPGDRVLSQVAAAAFPREDFEFDRVSNRDLDDAWSMSPNQMGNFNGGERSATEAQNVQSAYASVIGFQRQKIVGMFLGLVDTLMGLLQLNLDNYEAEPIVGPDGVKTLQEWDRSKIAGKYVCTTRQDASVLQDAGARVNQLMKFLNIAGKSGRINIDPIMAELAGLSGLDPAQVMLPPAQPKPEPLNVSYRFSGIADLLNPVSVALLMKAGQAPGPPEIEAAKQLILDAMNPPKQMPPGSPAQPGAMPWQIQQQLLEMENQQKVQEAAPDDDWAAMPRVTKRPEELGG